MDREEQNEIYPSIRSIWSAYTVEISDSFLLLIGIYMIVTIWKNEIP